MLYFIIIIEKARGIKMKKRLKQVFGIIISFLLILSSFSFGCAQEPKNNENLYTGDLLCYDLFFEFKTKYTEEEHIERIRARTEERLAEDIERDKIEKIDIEIVYSFYTKDPEYFLVEVEYKEEFIGFWSSYDIQYSTKHKHFFGMIYCDDYIKTPHMQDFIDGQSIYRARGYINNVKYHSSFRFAIEEGNRIYQIFPETGLHVFNSVLMISEFPQETIDYDIFKELSVMEQVYYLKRSREPISGNWFWHFPELY